MKELLAEIVASAIAAGIVALVTLAWRALSRFPWILVALGAGLLVFAAFLVTSLSGTNLRTEGSPAGTIMLVVFGGAVMVAGLSGLFLLGKGMLGMESRGPFTALLGLLALGAVLSYAYRVHRAADGGAEFRPGKYRVFPPTSELASQRRVAVGERYALAWKARRDAKSLQLSIPGEWLVVDGRGVIETIDGPRSIELALDGGGTMRLHRDDSTVDEAAFESLQGRVDRDTPAPRALWVDTARGGWRLLGLDCPKETSPPVPAPAGATAQRAACHVPAGALARWLPSIFGPSRVPLGARTERDTCQWAFPYRERIVTVGRAGRCLAPEGLAALGAAAALLERLDGESKSAPR